MLGALPGLAVCAGIALVATLLALEARIVGAPVFALALGVLTRLAMPRSRSLRAGTSFATRRVLQLAIVISGFGVAIGDVARTGWATLPVTIGTIAIALVLAPVLGRALGVERALRQLIGVGTAICGASAIAAVASVIEPGEADVALALATIFLYNITAVLIFPPLGHLMHLSQPAFGVWAGTAVNDTSSVLAAGYAYGNAAGTEATIVKLSRATLILPIVVAFALARMREHRERGARLPWHAIVPWFILWFAFAAAANSAHFVPAAWHAQIGAISLFLIAVALAGVGLQTDVRQMYATGARPLALGFLLWVAVAAASLVLQRAAGL